MKDFLKLIKVDFMQGVEEPWCNNQGVAILPYVLKNHEYYYLLTIENNPLFKNKQISKYSTITGGIENNNPKQTVISEKQLNNSNDALSLVTYGKLLLKNVIDKNDNNINRKLDQILQILHDMQANKKKV